ncbi:hypothetical protein NC00_18005 [Xanthomonas cannabis pv. phaseoli]|uniref:Uncharacterized protein n=1 Tax=Xanthomonas cannabis pv. phaseoli TaxID=1885902 RepID=A0AB34P638_9XANT|nr:hypothetical protein NC00_18005 [Xanthomonas cannabis pv. phaseoli]
MRSVVIHPLSRSRRVTHTHPATGRLRRRQGRQRAAPQAGASLRHMGVISAVSGATDDARDRGASPGGGSVIFRRRTCSSGVSGAAEAHTPCLRMRSAPPGPRRFACSGAVVRAGWLRCVAALPAAGPRCATPRAPAITATAQLHPPLPAAPCCALRSSRPTAICLL